MNSADLLQAPTSANKLIHREKGELSCLALILLRVKSLKDSFDGCLILFLRDPGNYRNPVMVFWNITKNVTICALSHFQYFLNISLKTVYNVSSYFANNQT